MNKSMPKGWLETKLGVVCTKPQYGWTTSSTTEGKIKLLRTTDISHPPVSWDKVPYCQKVPGDLEKYLVQVNDILVSRAGSIGLSYRISDKDKIENVVFASYLIRFKPLIVPEFVENYLLSNDYWGYISGFKSGIAVPNVNATKLKEMPFPLPPLAEQKRIAAKLDAVLPRIAKLKDRLSKSKELIKQFRQSVLNAAVTGKLTEEWRENHTHKKWDTYKLDEITEKITDGEHLKPTVVEKGIPFLTAKNIQENGVIFDDYYCVSKSDAEKFWKKCKPEYNDLLIVSRGATIGRISINKTKKDFTLLGSVILIKINSKDIINDFVYIYMKSDKTFEQLKALNGSTAQPAIYIKDIKNIYIQLPSVNEQHKIVNRVNQLLILAEKLEARLEKLSQQIDDLGKGVLAKAFQGELVSIEAELAEKENRSYETAEELLEKIKAEKKKLEAEKKKRRSR